MISIFEGRIGGGKTYLAVTRMLAHLAQGGTVFTNVSLKVDGCSRYLSKHYGIELDPEAVNIFGEADTFDFHRMLKSGSNDLPTLCVVDEAHLWFNARDHQMTATTRRGLLTFMSQSRKLHVDVIMIVQAMENLDAQFRRLAQEVWRMKDMKRLVLPLINIAYPFDHTFVFRMDAGARMIMQKKIVKRTRDVFDCYDTDALLRPVEFAGEVVMKRDLKKSVRSAFGGLRFDDVPEDWILIAIVVAAFWGKVAYG